MATWKRHIDGTFETEIAGWLIFLTPTDPDWGQDTNWVWTAFQGEQVEESDEDFGALELARRMPSSLSGSGPV